MMARTDSSRSQSDRTSGPPGAALGERIRQARLRAGHGNASAFGRMIGVQPNTVYRYENGSLEPSIHTLARISRVCKVPMAWIVEGDAYGAAEVLTQWLDTPRGRTATEEARAFLAKLPLDGLQPTALFYDLALVAFESGATPREAAAAAAFSEPIAREGHGKRKDGRS